MREYKFLIFGLVLAILASLGTPSEVLAQTRRNSNAKSARQPRATAAPRATTTTKEKTESSTNESTAVEGATTAVEASTSNDFFRGESATSEYQLQLNEKESRFLLTVYLQMSQFSFVGESLLGSALEVSALYALNQQFAAGISLSQALDPSAGLAILYTGIRAAGSYAILGTFIQRESMLSVDGNTAFVSTLGQGSIMAFEFGLEQLIFNGTSRIIPATGFSAGLRYDLSLWGMTWSLTGRYGQLVISEKLASMMTFGGGMQMRF